MSAYHIYSNLSLASNETRPGECRELTTLFICELGHLAYRCGTVTLHKKFLGYVLLVFFIMFLPLAEPTLSAPNEVDGS